MCDKCFAPKNIGFEKDIGQFFILSDFHHILLMVITFQASYEISEIMWSCDAMNFIQTPT